MKLVVVGFGLAAAGTIRDDHGHDHDHDIEGKAWDHNFHEKMGECDSISKLSRSKHAL